jgi:prepilin-type N-terminal cleavage/methylation domain-containing protein
MRGRRGFTLIELMIVVTIIGVLASLAIPALIQSVRRSKTSEATMNIRRIFDGAITAYQADATSRAGGVLAASSRGRSARPPRRTVAATTTTCGARPAPPTSIT